MNSLIENVVAKVLSPYLDGISGDNLKMGILSGRVSLRNLKLKPSLMEDLKLYKVRILSSLVESVDVEIPWKNPIGGKFVINISGVTARLAIAQSVPKEQMVILKREAIESLKKKLIDEMNKGLKNIPKQEFLGSDSYAAKLVRKLISSLHVSIRNIEISVSFVHAFSKSSTTNTVPVTDSEGFADAASQCSSAAAAGWDNGDDGGNNGPCIVILRLEQFSLLEFDSCLETKKNGEKLNPKAMSKQLTISGLSLCVAGSVLLPSTSLYVDIIHNPSESSASSTNSFLSVRIHGMDRCDVQIQRNQLVRLKESLLGGGPKTFDTIPMTAEMRHKYTEKYVSNETDIEDLIFIFHELDIAKAELVVDRSRKKLPQVSCDQSSSSPPWWKFGLTGGKDQDSRVVEQFKKDLLEEIESTREEIPGLISLEIDVGKNWTIQLVHNDATAPLIFATAILWGGHVRCDISTGASQKGFNLRVISGGLSVFQGNDKLVVDFREQSTITLDHLSMNASRSLISSASSKIGALETTELSSASFVDAMESVLTETEGGNINYTAADVEINFIKSPGVGVDISINGNIQPLTITYQPGLIESFLEYFSFLSDPVVVDSIEDLIKNRDRILARGKEFISSVRDYSVTTFSSPDSTSSSSNETTNVSLNLCVSGPLIVLPSSRSGDQQIVLSLGEMVANLPKTCISSEAIDATITAPIFAKLDKIAVSCIVVDLLDEDEPGGEQFSAAATTTSGDGSKGVKTAIQILAPTAVEFMFSFSSRELGIRMNEEISIRLSPEILKVITKFISGIKKELDSIPRKVGVNIKGFTDEFNMEPVVVENDTQSAAGTSSSPPLSMSLNVNKFQVILSDGALDVVSFETNVPNLTITLADNRDLSGTIDCVRIIARNYNSIGGIWEPILEPSYFSGFFQISETDITARLRTISAVNTVISIPLVQSIIWISKTFAALSDDQEIERSTFAGKRFRVINSTNFKMYIVIKRSAGRQPKIIPVPPSSSPIYIDHWVLAYSAKEVGIKHSLGTNNTVVLRVPLDKGFSEKLSVGGKDAVVQSLSMGTTSADSSRCILVSYENFFFNQCDVPLVVRGIGRGSLPTPLSYLIGVPSLVGAGSVKTVSTSSSFDEQTKLTPDQFLLQPGTFITVPVFPESQWSVSNAETYNESVSFDLLDFARRAARTEPPNFLANIDCGRGFHVRLDGLVHETDYPHRGDLRKVFLKPPLVVSNSIPCSIRIAHSDRRSIFSLQPGEYRNIHDVSSSNDLSKMSMSLSFINADSEWSKTMFGPYAASAVGAAAVQQPLLVRDESQSPKAKDQPLKKSNAATKLEERYMLSQEINKYHPVHLTAATSSGSPHSVSLYVKWWLIDRTGLNLTIYGNNSMPLPRSDNNGPVWLLPDPDTPIVLQVFRGRSDYVQVTLPDSGWFDAKIGNHPVVFVSRENFFEKFVEIVPKYTVFNGLVDRPIFVSNCISDVLGDEDMLTSHTGTVLMSDSFTFSLDARANPHSVPIPLRETFAGVWPLDVDGSGNVVRIEIAPDCGSICVSIFAGSSVVVCNEKRRHSVEIMVDRGNFFEIPPLTEKPIGWRDPFTNPQIETTMRIMGQYFGGPQQFIVPLARAGDDVRYGGCVNVVPAQEPQSILIIVEKSNRDHSQMHAETLAAQRSSSSSRIVRIEFEAHTVSASIVHQRKETIYCELSLIKFLVLQDSVMRRVSLMVSDIQADTCVSRKPNCPNPVVLVNRGDSSRAFLEFTFDQNTNVSYNVSLIPLISIQLDSLVIEVDSKFMISLDDLLNDLINVTANRQENGGRKSAIIYVPGSDVVAVKKGTVTPLTAPPILILDTFEVSQISLRLWVDFALKSMGFMPVSLKLVVGLLSLGDSFKLDGAGVTFNRRAIKNYKGSLIQFKDSVVGEFVNEAMRNIAALLGSSSLLTIPRAPIHLISNVGAFGLEKATRAVGGIGDFISNWTSDSQYRDAQAKIRKTKNIQGVTDGFIEGATRLGEGAEGFLDIFRKPVQGAKAGGCVGCLKGLGKGIVGSIFKPLTKVGEAVSDVGTGIARTVKPGASKKRPILERKRVPRPLYGITRSCVADYNELDALIVSKLSKEFAKGVEVIIPVSTTPDAASITACLILYSRRIVVAQLVHSRNPPRNNSQSFRSAAESSRSITDVSEQSTTTSGTVSSKILAVSIERELALRDLISVNAVYYSESVLIQDKFGVELSLRLSRKIESSGFMTSFLSAIETAANAAVSSKRDYVDWSEVRLIQREMDLEVRDKAIADSLGLSPDGENGMTKKVEIYEVERFLMTYGWTTPYMALDSGNEGWRWLDMKMLRHSKIRPRLSRREAANAKLPPISAGDLWKALDDWAIVTDDAVTDTNGWQYAISFNSSTWYPRPGITASVRRRKWVRHYS